MGWTIGAADGGLMRHALPRYRSSSSHRPLDAARSLFVHSGVRYIVQMNALLLFMPLHLCCRHKTLNVLLRRRRRLIRMHARCLAEAFNRLGIFCLPGSCRGHDDDTNSCMEASLPDHPPGSLCELHVCELGRKKDDCARLT